MIEWLKRHIKEIKISWLSFVFRESNDEPGFRGFARWREVKGVVSGASDKQVKLEDLPGITRDDWKLLSKLWFWQVTKGENTSTFGYRSDELPEAFLEPLRRWIGFATLKGGKGERRQGEITCVNVASDTISVMNEAPGH